MITLLVIFLCAFIPIFTFFIQKQYHNFLSLLPFLFVYPLVIHFCVVFNRCIIVEDNKIILQIDHEKTSIFNWPKFYQDEFSLSDLRYYGVYSAMYIKGYKKAERINFNRNKNANDKRCDILDVKEGKLKIPVGTIVIGNPLAFVFKKEQYIIDDYLFTPEQYAALFYTIETNCRISPSGGISAAKIDLTSQKSLASSLILLVGIVLALILPFGILYVLQTLTDLPIHAFTFNASESTILFFSIFGNLCLVLKYRLKAIKHRNFESYDLIEFIATVCLALGYIISLLVFVLSYIV